MYLIFDLDQTLLNRKSSITKYTKITLKECQNRGHLIVINTARSFPNTKKYLKKIKPDYVICNGGTEVYNGLGECIFFHPVDTSFSSKIVKEIFINPSTVGMSIQTKEHLYTSSLDYANKNIFAEYFDFNNDFNEEISKILIQSNDKEFVLSLANKYNLNYTSYLNGNWYRLSPCDKYDGNLSLFKLLKDDNPIDITFGDDLGDLNMIKNAHMGIAMKNSVDKVIKEVNIKTKYTNKLDGCAHHLNYLIKNNII